MSISSSTLRTRLLAVMRWVMVVGLISTLFISSNRSIARVDGVDGVETVTTVGQQEQPTWLPQPPPVMPPDMKPDPREPTPPQDIKTEYGEKDWLQPIDPNAKIDESLRDGKPK